MRYLKKLVVVFCLLFVTMFALQTVLPENVSVISVAEAASVKLNKKKATLTVGDNLQLQVEGSDKKVKWSTSDKKVATVSSKGLVKAKKAGKAVITAKIGKKSYTCKVTVKSVFKLSKKNVTLLEGDSTAVTVTCTMTEGTISFDTSDSSVVDCEWDTKWKGNKIKLLLYAKNPGTAKVTIKNKKTKDSVVINVTVTQDSKWKMDSATIMLGKLKDALADMGTCIDYAKKAMKNEAYLDLAETYFTKTATDIQSCINYASAMDPVTSTEGETVVGLLQEAYSVYEQFDSASATGFSFLTPVLNMDTKLLMASELFISFAEQIIQ